MTTRPPSKVQQLLHRGGDRLRDLYYASFIYQTGLGGSRASQLLFMPNDRWPGDSEIGKAIAAGDISFKADRPLATARIIIDPHTFAWMRDLRSAGSDTGRRRGQELIYDWIKRFGRFDRHAWRTAILADRIVHWISHYDYFCRDADEKFRRMFFDSLSRQSRHLSRVARRTARGAERVRAAKGLIYAGACVPGAHARFEKGLTFLEAEAGQHIHPDGGIWERNPSLQLRVLKDLVDVRALLHACHKEQSVVVQNAIDRAAPLLRMLRHGDGGLAIFNGGFEETDWLVDMALNQSGSTGKAPENAPHTGFQRVVAGRTTILLDTGTPPATGFDTNAHAGVLSFEMSVGRTRLIVNCGAGYRETGQWQSAGRYSAAHSTLVIDDRNSSAVFDQGGIGARPTEVTCQRRESDGSTLIEASHNGYVRMTNLLHRRRIFCSADGEDVRGEDVIEYAGARTGGKARFAIRFHLHPDVEIESMSMWEKGGRIVDFKREGGGRWQLHTEINVNIDLEESFYQGVRGKRQQSNQVVLSGVMGDEEKTTVRWAIRRKP